MSADAFWSKVDMSGGKHACWPWLGSVGTWGYGNGAPHRRACLLDGRDPIGLEVHHLCSNKLCCNPKHLVVVSHKEHCKLDRTGAENGARKHPERWARGSRHWTHCKPERIARGANSSAKRHPERVPRGEQSGLSKLTTEQVVDIRKRWPDETQRDLAREFNVSDFAVHCIVHRKTWRHV
jgi:hypothetical protein